MTTQTPTNSHVRVAVSLLGCRQSTFDCLAATSLAVANFCKPIHNNQRDTHSFIHSERSIHNNQRDTHSSIHSERSIHNNQRDTHSFTHSERSIHNNQRDIHSFIHSERDQSTATKEIPIHSFIQRDQSTTIKETIRSYCFVAQEQQQQHCAILPPCAGERASQAAAILRGTIFPRRLVGCGETPRVPGRLSRKRGTEGTADAAEAGAGREGRVAESGNDTESNLNRCLFSLRRCIFSASARALIPLPQRRTLSCPPSLPLAVALVWWRAASSSERGAAVVATWLLLCSKPWRGVLLSLTRSSANIRVVVCWLRAPSISRSRSLARSYPPSGSNNLSLSHSSRVPWPRWRSL